VLELHELIVLAVTATATVAARSDATDQHRACRRGGPADQDEDEKHNDAVETLREANREVK
jgi:hypothetical protein